MPNDPREAVLEAQWRILARLGAVRIDDSAALMMWMDKFLKQPGRRGFLAAPAQKDRCIRALGDWIRREKAKEGGAS